MSIYYSLLTNTGAAQLTYNESNSLPTNLAEIAVGDNNGSFFTPNQTDGDCVNEVYRDSISAIWQDPLDNTQLKVQLVIPASEGGFTIREFRIYDTNGTVMWTGNTHDIVKPTLLSGIADDLNFIVTIKYSNVANITLLVDPAVTLASQTFVNAAIATHNADAAAHAAANYVSKTALQNGSYLYADATGTADAITATYTPAIAALTDGMAVYLDAATANLTAAPTFAPNGLTARTIVKNNAQPLAAGDIAGSGHILHLVYRLNVTQWELANPAITAETHGALLNSTTAKTTPVDADMTGLMDSAASNVLKKLSWANLKASLKTYFDGLYASLSTTDAAIKTISASVAANALTISTPAAQTVNFRSATLSDGTINSRSVAAQSLVVPSGATLGTINATQSRLAVLAIDNAGTPELAVTNIAAGKNLDETTLISTNAIATTATGTGVIAVTTGILTISGSPTGTWEVGMAVKGTGVPAGTYITALGTGTGGAGTYYTNITTAVSSTAMTGVAGMGIYSTTARSSLPFRVLGYVESTQATAGTWATTPSTVQGNGGNALVNSVVGAYMIANQVLSANGYQKLPGGLIIQWGVYVGTIANGVTVVVTFPIAFPTACVVGHAIENSTGELGTGAALNSTFTSTVLNAHNKDDAAAKTNFSWLAIGY